MPGEGADCIGTFKHHEFRIVAETAGRFKVGSDGEWVLFYCVFCLHTEWGQLAILNAR